MAIQIPNEIVLENYKLKENKDSRLIDRKIILAISAAWQAGVEVLKIYDTAFTVHYKTDTSPVTLADQKAENIIRNELEKEGLPIISEETKQAPYNRRKKWQRFWMVDPLDGTKEFVDKNGEFTINIAYIENGVPCYGVLYAPFYEQMLIADVPNRKVFRLAIDKFNSLPSFHQLEQYLEKVPKLRNTECRTLAISRSHLDKTTQKIMESLVSTSQFKVVRIGSALKYIKLVIDEIQLYFRFSPTMEWDNAAGHALCLARGMEMCQIPDKKPIEYNSPSLISPSFVAGTSTAIQQFFDCI